MNLKKETSGYNILWYKENRQFIFSTDVDSLKSSQCFKYTMYIDINNY